MNYYQAFCEEVREALRKHIFDFNREVKERKVDEAMKDFERIFKDYGVDWKLTERIWPPRKE